MKKTTKSAKSEAKNEASVEEEGETVETNSQFSPVEIADFTREFAARIDAGKSLVASLTELADKQQNEHLQKVIRAVNTELQAGGTLSGAMSRYPEVFDQGYIDSIRFGEVNGTLELQLHGLSHLDDILTFDQAVQFLQTSRPTLYRLLNQGVLKGIRVGRQWRFRKADLVAYMERRPATVQASELSGIEQELEFIRDEIGEKNPNDISDPSDEFSDEEGKINELVNEIFRLAIKRNASDIHITPQRTFFSLRLRIDGVLHEIRQLPPNLHSPMVDRLKVMTNMNVTEKRVPQDGRIHLKYQDKDFDIRVATCPAALGESVVMRVLNPSMALTQLSQMEMGSNLAELTQWLSSPNGLIIFTGPTGSGKTTTVYAVLQELNTPDRKIVTVEDPVEVLLPNTVQVHVNRKAGLTFATMVRAFLRQDPDIIMTGELPNLDTAEVAHHAAFTGHLVVTTMSVASALEAPLRLRDMGLEAYLISDCLVGTSAQRLLRRVCPQCSKEKIYLSTEQKSKLSRMAKESGFSLPKNAIFERPKGCDYCRSTGYRGRIPIYEFISWTEPLAEALARGAGRDELKTLAVQGGASLLLADGLGKVLEGHTTLDEVQRVLALTL